MPKFKDPRASSRRPTPYADLNALLADLVEGASGRLGENFVGAYLQGSFALGDFDEHSDVDFMVVTHEDISAEVLADLQALHARLHRASDVWGPRLEGSYAPKAILRRWATSPRDPPGEPRADDWADPGTSGMAPRVYPFFFIGNGEEALVRSEHDNTQNVRWVLREKGIALAGPPARTLIDAVTPDALREEVRSMLERVTPMLESSGELEVFWIQSFMVLLVARMLYGLATGRVGSKKTAAAFAKQTLEPRFADLIARAWSERDDRPSGPPERVRAYLDKPADPADVAATLDLIRHAEAVAAAQTARAQTLAQRQLAVKGRQPPGGGWRGGPPDRGRSSGRGWTPPPTRPGGRGRRG